MTVWGVLKTAALAYGILCLLCAVAFTLWLAPQVWPRKPRLRLLK